MNTSRGRSLPEHNGGRLLRLLNEGMNMGETLLWDTKFGGNE